MTLIVAITVGVVFAASVYLLMSRELKSIAIGMFLLGHAANLAIIAVSKSPIGKRPPVLGPEGALTGAEVDPLPQALILTAIVIGFAVQAFLLTLLVLTWRRTDTLNLDELAGDRPADSSAADSSTSDSSATGERATPARETATSTP
jgi:multicomponent Na+:H+ antiporter subunit C